MFVSYSQNLEDVMLWRALGTVTDGFYIDVGANDPEKDSVTKAFYLKGWHGINIEPSPKWYDRLESQRPNDYNVNCVAGDKNGSTLFHLLPDGYSTSNYALAQHHILTKGFETTQIRVGQKSLNSILEKIHPACIHFLKIDVETDEHKVLKGFDLTCYRPWIILIEATYPDSQEPNFTAWEPLLLSHDYAFVYFDGINRFYLAREQRHLEAFFLAPPNFFDNYIRWDHLSLKEQVADLQTKRQSDAEHFIQLKKQNDLLEQENKALQQENHQQTQLVDQARKQLEEKHSHINDLSHQIALHKQCIKNWEKFKKELESSTSWRITKPVRMVSDFCKKEAHSFLQGMGVIQQNRLKAGLLLHLRKKIFNHALSAKTLFLVFKYFPWIEIKLKRIYHNAVMPKHVRHPSPKHLPNTDLSHSEQRIYEELIDQFK